MKTLGGLAKDEGSAGEIRAARLESRRRHAVALSDACGQGKYALAVELILQPEEAMNQPLAVDVPRPTVIPNEDVDEGGAPVPAAPVGGSV